MKCPDARNQVEHPTHWYVVQAAGTTYAQGQCPGWAPEEKE